MQKILALLEKYVQWGVLALGAAFLFYMVWSYLYVNPAARTMKGVLASPGTVDKIINDESASQLEQRTKQTHPEFHIDVHLDAKIDLNHPTTRPVDPMAAIPMWDSWYSDVGKQIGPGGIGPVPLVKNLPDLPPLGYVDYEPLRTVLAVNAPAAAPAAGAAPAPAPAAAGQGVHQDTDSVTTFWSLPTADLAKAYSAAFKGKLRPSQQTAIFVRAVVTREERLSSGDWANDITVPSLPAATPPPTYPVPNQPAFQADAAAFKTWAIAAGDQAWLVAATYPTVALPNAELQWLALELWIPYRAKLKAEEEQPIIDVPAAAPVTPAAPAFNAPQAVQNAVGGGGFARGVRGGPGGGNIDAPRPIAPPPAQAPQPVVQGEPVFVVPPIPKLQPVPDGGFNPAAAVAAGDMELFFHDLTVEPGKTYRYKVRYSLLNPVFGLPNQVANPQFANQFEIDSPDSAWSEPITVPSRTKFWVDAKASANLPHGGGEVAFDVFSWHDGVWQQKTYNAQAGDEIGELDATLGNFLTHWTVLDVRGRTASGGQSVLLIPDYGGEALVRNVLTDNASQDYKHFMVTFKAQAPVAPAAAPPANGAAQPPGAGAPFGGGQPPAGAAPPAGAPVQQ